MPGNLARLSCICTTPNPGVDTVQSACQAVGAALGAEEAYVIRAGDPHFVRLCCDDDPTSYEIKQKGYWLIWRELATNPRVPAGIFDVIDRLVQPGSRAAPGRRGTHVASILPGDESNSELLIVRGPWPNGLTSEQVAFVVAARPMLAHLVGNVLDSECQARQREQLSALADVSKAFSEAREMDKVLTSAATAMAKASGSDWVGIYLYNDALDTVIDAATNLARHYETDTAAMVRDGRLTAVVGQHRPENLRAWAIKGTPGLVSDVFGPALEDVERELGMQPENLPLLRAWFERAHILSMAVFPLMFQNQFRGRVMFCSSTKRAFDPAEVDFLAALASQAATTIEGLRLYRDLEQSKEELSQYVEKLEETSRVEHFLARTDALTGLPNRRHIEESLETECARAGRYDRPVSIAMADLDHLKEINDDYGHHTGDEALKFTASVGRQACRTADFVGRLGGDEFVFILPSTALENAKEFAERFRQRLAAMDFTHPKQEEPIRMTVSLGVAQATPDTFSNARVLLERADKAMYEAKAAGGNRTVAAVGDSARAA